MISTNQALPRVALVTGGLKLGGSTSFLINLAGELVRRQIPVEVFSFEMENPMAADFQRLKISVFCQADRRRIFEDRLEQILERVREFQPTAVVANLGAVSFEMLRYVPAGVFRLGIAHSDDPNVYEMLRHYLPHLDALAVVSKELKQRISSLPDFQRLPVHYLAHGVPMPSETELPARSFTEPLQILYLGRLEQEAKRVRLFPKILEQLKASGIPFHWTIAGDGPEKKKLEEAMKSSPSQTVSFTGQVDYAQVPEIVKAHDVCLLTSDYEGFALSVLEAMCAGLVPVASDLPCGIPEMVDKTTGILVRVDDVSGYARAIIHLHNHRDELAAKSAAARERVKAKFSVDAMADRWLAAFPKTVPAIGEWPAHWDIKPPLSARHPVYFSPPMRVIRRLAAKFLG